MRMFDQLPCPVLVTDRDGIVHFINQNLCDLVGGDKDCWLVQPMERLFPKASQIFLQSYIWPMLMRENAVREIRLQILGDGGKPTPVFANCQKTTQDGTERFNWVFFVSIERSRYEQELLQSRQRAETVSEALKKSEKFVRTVADAMPSLISYWDTQLQCQFANTPHLDWFERTP
jgi:PAS domain-containing protein